MNKEYIIENIKITLSNNDNFHDDFLKIENNQNDK